MHVEYLARELARVIDVRVHCFGEPRDSPLVAAAYKPWSALSGEARYSAALQAMSVDLAMAAGVKSADLVHSHTWYTNLAGQLAKLLYGIPHVATTHSLEPLRPWKAEQLGGGYALSSFCERTGLEGADAVVAVSEGMRRDVLTCYPAIDPRRVSIIHNGVDPQEYRPDPLTDVVARRGIDPKRPYVLFVGRMTRQKGIVHLLDAAPMIDRSAQLVFCAGSADTTELADEVHQRVHRLKESRGGFVWIEEMLPRAEVIQLMSHASVFTCPSIYEPFGLVNVEAMACETPVVASHVGGIPEVVEDGVTGYLVRVKQGKAGAPVDPEQFARDLAAAVNRVLRDPARGRSLGHAGRQRVVERFSWAAVAQRTVDLYRNLVPASPAG